MKSITILMVLMRLIVSSFCQNCDKQFEVNKFDKFKKEQILKSNLITFDKPSLIAKKEISFWVLDSNRFFIHFEFVDTRKITIQNNSEVGILLSNDEAILFNIKNVRFKKIGTTYKTEFDCQIKSKKQLEMFYKYSISELKFYYSNRSFELSNKEQSKLKNLIICTISEIGISNINYNQSISKSIGNDNISTDTRSSNCLGIYKKVDKFTGEIKYSSPIFNKITLYKIIEDDNVFYYMRLKCRGATANVMIEGVTILFDSGFKIDRPEIEISVDITSEGYEYSAFIDLSKDEMNLIANNQMTDFRLYIYDCVVNVFKRKKYMNYATCLLSK